MKTLKKQSISFQIASETSVAQAKANSSLRDVQDLERRVESVKLQYIINQQHLEDTTAAVNQADLKAQRAANDAKQLEDVRQRVLLGILERYTKCVRRIF